MQHRRGTLSTRVNRSGVHGASPEYLMMGYWGGRIGGEGGRGREEEGEDGSRVRVRERQRDGFILCGRTCPGQALGFLAQRRDFVWSLAGAPEQKRETEKRALGAEKKRDHVGIFYYSFFFSLRLRSKRGRAPAGVDMGLNRLWGARECAMECGVATLVSSCDPSM